MTDCQALVLLVEMDGRVFCVVAQPDRRARRGRRRGSARRRRPRAGGVGDLPRGARRGARARPRAGLSAAAPRAAHGPRRSCRRPAAHGRRRTRRSPRAMVACQRYGQSGILVAEDGRLVGVGRAARTSTRRSAHGLSHAPVKGIMSGRVRDRGRGRRPLAELQRLLAARREGRVAVLDGDRIVGVVTRSDVLRALGERTTRRPSRPSPIADELARARAARSRVFEAVAAVERAVRRRLPRRRHRPRHPARRARASTSTSRSRATRSRSRRRSRTRSAAACARTSKFGTAVVLYGDGRARRRRHGAHRVLRRARPRCRPSSTRRSARTSSAATSRSTPWPSRSRAPTSAGSSIPSAAGATSTAKTIRVLHNLSFIDDPTRIFRGDPLREPLRLPDGRPHRAARARVRSRWASSATSPRRGSATSSRRCSRRARSSTRSCAWPSSAPRRAIHPHLAADEEAVGPAAAPDASCATATGSTSPPGGSGSRRSRGELPPDEVYDWLAAPEGAAPRRRARSPHAVTVGPRLVERLAGRRRAGRGGRRSPSRTRPTRRSSRSRSPTCRAAATRTSTACATCGSRSAAPTWPSSVSASRRVWGRSSPELRRRKLNGELDGRDSELAAARELIEP